MERRQITLGRLIRRHYLWVPLLPVAFAVLFGLIAQSMRENANRLAVHGIEGIATVTDRDIRVRRDSDGNQQRDHYLTYRFSLPAGDTVSFRRTVSEGFYRRTGLGMELPVRYIPHDPATHELEPGSTAQGSWIFGALALVLGGVGAASVWIIGRRKASLLRAARHGEVRQARVTQIEPANIVVNGQPRYRLRWTDAAGDEGHSGPHPLKALPEPGSVIVVYVDGRTRTGWWEEDF